MSYFALKVDEIVLKGKGSYRKVYRKKNLGHVGKVAQKQEFISLSLTL